MRYEQKPPFCVQIELTEGCNLYCDFCGLQGIREKPGNFKFMTVRHAKLIAEELAKHRWNSRIEFAMHGEPTMNPDATSIVGIFRDALPKNQLMMTSNGGGLRKDVRGTLERMFNAGLNIFAFDAYEYVKIKDHVKAALTDDTPTSFDVHWYPDSLDYSPHNRYPRGTRKFIWIQDISVATTGTHSKLNNHCGAGAEPEPIQARCAKVFRELSVRYNGDVAICCNDWRGVYKCGNVIRDGLAKVWHGPEMTAARKYLLLGQRSKLKPCDVCNARSYRVGLLPDHKGLATMPRPTKKDADVVKRATARRSYTEAVLRPWEIKRRKAT